MAYNGYIYKPPYVTDTDFTNYFTKHFDNCIVKYENYIVLDDLNFDLLNQSKCQSIHDICDILHVSQIVKEPTCFMRNSTPSLVDDILTNKKTMNFNTHNIPTGVSDCYNLISTTTKGNLPVQDKRKISYRSYRNVDIDMFDNDLQKVVISENSDIKNVSEINCIYSNYEKNEAGTSYSTL